MSLAEPSGLVWNYARIAWKDYVSGQTSQAEFSLTAFRFLFIYAAGFSHRKQQLIFDFRPESQSQLFVRTANWIEANLNDGKQQKQRPLKNVLRMG
jgi:hypothetical protein